MVINLKKGQKIDLTKGDISLRTVTAGLGWDINKYDGRSDFDLDVSIFMVGENGKVPSQEDFVFYGNLVHKSGSVEHIGDNRTGQGEGDDEEIRITLNQIPSEIKRVVFTVTIYEAEERKQNFGQVSNAYIRIVNSENNKELIRYDLGEDFSIETAVVVGEIYRYNGEWKFNAIGDGYRGGLEALCKEYGIDIA